METTIKKIAETARFFVYELQHEGRIFLLNSAGGILETTQWNTPYPALKLDCSGKTAIDPYARPGAVNDKD